MRCDVCSDIFILQPLLLLLLLLLLQAIVVHENGELSITNNPETAAAANVPLTVAEAAARATSPPVFVLRPVLAALSSHWASPGGGLVLNVTLEDGSAGFDVENPTANEVKLCSRLGQLF
jgi:hypothetical protein